MAIIETRMEIWCGKDSYGEEKAKAIAIVAGTLNMIPIHCVHLDYDHKKTHHIQVYANPIKIALFRQALKNARIDF